MGDRPADVDAPRRWTRDTLPLYAKAGTILPLGPVAQHTGEVAAAHGGPDELTLRVYLPRLPDPPRANGVLHEDGGTTTFTYDNAGRLVEGAPAEGALRRTVVR